jgi:hypothetical protein
MEVSGQPHSPPALPQKKSSELILFGVQVAPKVRFGHFGEESSILLLSGYKPRIIQPVITIQTTVLLETWLNWLETDA